jgi:hypothetical protein
VEWPCGSWEIGTNVSDAAVASIFGLEQEGFLLYSEDRGKNLLRKFDSYLPEYTNTLAKMHQS